MANIFDLFKKIETKSPSPSAPITWLVVGLGNPGAKYENTRHNAGFRAIDTLAEKYGIRVKDVRFHALCGDGLIGDERVLLVKPQTMMNASGLAVGEAAKFYKIPPERVLVVSDDITQPVGRMRFRAKGSAGGHNGLKDIIEKLASEDFPRLRVGIGEKPHPDYDLAAWVLSEFTKDENAVLDELFRFVGENVSLILKDQHDTAVNQLNGYGAEKKA